MNRFVVVVERQIRAEVLYSYLRSHPDIKIVHVFKNKDATVKDHDLLDIVFNDEKDYKAVGVWIYVDEVSPWISNYIKGSNIHKQISVSDPTSELTNLGKSNHSLSYKDFRPSKDKKWRNLRKRRGLLIDFLGVEDKVLFI